MSRPWQGSGVILASFIVAMMLTLHPLPDWAEYLRPAWVAMVLIYWCMALPERVGVGVGWMTGLLLDVLRGGLLGQHALSFAIIAYITLQLYQRLRVFPLWQQAFSVFVLVLLHLMLQLWIKGISGQPTGAWDWLLPAFGSTLLWPAVFLLLRGLRRRFGVS